MTPCRIALCDDHPFLRKGVAAILDEEPDLQVVAQAGSLDELRAQLVALPIDLVLLDIDLPGASGLDAVPEIAPRCRVIMLSAFDEPTQVRAAMAHGASGYLRKDADMSSLLRAIRDVMAGRTVLDPRIALKLSRQVISPEEARFRRAVAELSPRHREVLALIAEGRSTQEIAERLHISFGTAKNHVTAILHNLDVEDRTKLALLAARYRVDRA